jgi:hypothetical protein
MIKLTQACIADTGSLFYSVLPQLHVLVDGVIPETNQISIKIDIHTNICMHLRLQ